MSADVIPLDRRRAEHRIERRIETRAGRYLTLQAFLRQRRVHVFKTLSTVSISFMDETTADEFFNFIIRSGRGR